MTVLFGACSLGFGALDPRWRIVASGDQVAHSSARELLSQSRAALGYPCVPKRPHDGLAIVGNARLDDREVLSSRLGLNSTDVSDADLILASYARWGIACVDQLGGDWAFALWDAQHQRLLLARDATGNAALYWWQGRGEIAFSNDLQALTTRLPTAVRPSMAWAVDMMAVFDGVAGPFGSPYEEVQALPSGHLLVLEGGAAQPRQWWQASALAPLPADDIEAYREELVRLYGRAVEERLGSASDHVGLTLSSGLDSGSVAALAAPVMRARGRVMPGYVHVPNFSLDGANPNREGNEWPLAELTARFVGQVQPRPCASAGVSVLAGLRQLIDSGLPPTHGAGNLYWILDILSQARADGVTIMLTGQGGNSTVSYKGDGNLWPVVRANRWRHVARCLNDDRAGWWPALVQRLVKPALRRAGLDRWRAGRAQKTLDEAGMPWGTHACIQPGVAHELALVERMRAVRHDPTFRCVAPDWEQRFRLGVLPATAGLGAFWGGLADRFGMTIADPTRARRVVEFCSRLPDETFWAGGLRRGLIRQGLRGRLPDEVLFSARKGRQSADLLARLAAYRDELMDELDAVSAHPCVQAWMDMPRLRASALAALEPPRSSSPGTQADVLSPVHMIRHLGLAMFLARH